MTDFNGLVSSPTPTAQNSKGMAFSWTLFEISAKVTTEALEND